MSRTTRGELWARHILIPFLVNIAATVAILVLARVFIQPTLVLKPV